MVVTLQLRYFVSMKKCLQCPNEFEAKRESAKFCSDKCRVAWHRKHGKKDGVTKFQMQVLYNSILEAIEKMALPQLSNFVPANTPTVFSGIIPQVAPTTEKTFQQFMNQIPDLQYEDEFRKFVSEIEAATKLSEKQKNLLLTNMRQSKL